MSALLAWAHPRTRGEKFQALNAHTNQVGSPPRTRGKGNLIVTLGKIEGLTPAHAGKSFAWVQALSGYGAHPRARGEKFVPLKPCSIVVGSPPRTRGKAGMVTSRLSFRGLTPAHAGKRVIGTLMDAPNQAHPRARGEKAIMGLNAWTTPGSPPRTRGKAFALLFPDSPIGLTPAHAGKSWMILDISSMLWAHPRARGEKVKKAPLNQHLPTAGNQISLSLALSLA